jgi:hypothetical protein
MKFFHCGIHQARDLESSCEVDQVGHCEVHQAKDLESFCEVDSVVGNAFTTYWVLAHLQP